MALEPVTVVVTSSFPFGGGEQFIESEAPHWARTRGRVVFLPEKTEDLPARPLPGQFEVRTDLADAWWSRPAQVRAAARAACSGLWWRELAYLARHGLLSPYRVRHAFLSATRVMMVLASLRRLAAEIGRPIDLVYAYWLSVSATAAVLARRQGVARRAVARAHGTDVYEDARPERYTALIRQIAPELDVLLPISRDAGDFAVARYGFRPAQVQVARLGVVAAAGTSPQSPPGELSVVSVSALRALKQVHLIAAAVAEVARRRPDLEVTWTHAGTGELEPELRRQVDADLAPLPNLRVQLLGQLSNAALLAWYRAHPADVFVNASTHEGVPVSIMEAMAHGIPAVAPAVGGVPELVPPGRLLSPPLTPGAIADGILELAESARRPGFREEVAAAQRARFDADANYAALTTRLSALAASDA